MQIKTSKSFDKSLKKIKNNKDLLEISKVIKMLKDDIILPIKHRNHNLSGNKLGCQECHIKPDLLLIYKKNKKELMLYLLELGSHSDLFGK